MSKKENTISEHRLDKANGNRHGLAKQAYYLLNELTDQGLYGAFEDRPDMMFKFTINPPMVSDPYHVSEKRVELKSVRYVGGSLYIVFLRGAETDYSTIEHLSVYDRYRVLEIIADSGKSKLTFFQGEWTTAEPLPKRTK